MRFLLNPFRFAAARTPGDSAAYTAAVNADAPWSYWLFDEPNGSTTFADNTAGARTLLSVNSVFAGETGLLLPGNSVRFDSTRYIKCNADYGAAIAAAIDGDKNFSVDFVYRPDSLTGTIFHIGNDSVNYSQGIGLSCSTDGSITLQLRVTNTWQGFTTATGVLSVGNTYHIAVTRATGGTYKLYVNGVGIYSYTMAGSLNCANNAAYGGTQIALAVAYGGGGSGTHGAYHACKLDAVAIYTSTLSAARVLVHAQAANVA